MRVLKKISAIRKSNLYILSCYAALSILVVLALSAFLRNYNVPDYGYPFDAHCSVTRADGTAQSRTVPWLTSSAVDGDFRSGIFTAAMTAVIPQSAAASGRDLVLVFPHVTGNGLRVTFNGEVLGTEGELSDGDSSIWNAVHMFSVRAPLLREKNSVLVEINGRYDAGVTKLPFLAEASDSRARLFFLLLFSRYAVLMLIGALLFLGLVVIGTGWVIASEKTARIALGGASICVAVFLFDFAYIDHLPVTLVIFKKTVVAFRHIAVALFAWGYLRMLRRKIDVWFAVFVSSQILSVCAIIFIPHSMIELRRVYQYTYLTSIPFMGYLLALVLFSFSNERKLRVLLFGVLIGFAAAVRDVAFMTFGSGIIYVSHYGFIMLSMATVVFLVQDLLSHYQRLVAEKKKSALFFEESLHDPLTGAFNRKVLPIVEKEISQVCSVMLFDLDNFKTINDRYGHAFGDSVLMHLSSTVKKKIRSNDYLVRMGGDEFLVILSDCPKEKAVSLAGGILSAIEDSEILSSQNASGDDAFGGYSVSIGVAYSPDSETGDRLSLDQMIAKADSRMYQVKRGGKAGIASSNRF